MRKLVCMLVLAAASAASFAQVFPSPFFATAPNLIDGFDAMPAGLYTSFPMFTGSAVCSRTVATGALVVGNTGGLALTAPNYLFGRGTDVQIKTIVPRSQFGGFFQQGVSTPPVALIRFSFYDQFNFLIGSVSVPCPTSWTWIGWSTLPNWSRVEIDGISTSTIGGNIAMDELRVG